MYDNSYQPYKIIVYDIWEHGVGSWIINFVK